MIPIPVTEQSLLERKTTNYSLLSPRLVEWTQNRRSEFSVNTEIIRELCQKSKNSFSYCSKLLENIQNRQNMYISSLKNDCVTVFEIKSKLISPFITGLGSGHSTETGMILDRNTGLPYIPASSIKGVLRLAKAINCADADGNIDENDERIVKYFGTTSSAKEAKRGQLMILDAYSESVPTLKVDIMNPHFGKYYSGENKQPVEIETPKPIKFLVVKEGVTFVFRCAFIPFGNVILTEKERQNVQNDVNEMFRTAFEKVGFGGKTSIGYGRFKLIKLY